MQHLEVSNDFWKYFFINEQTYKIQQYIEFKVCYNIFKRPGMESNDWIIDDGLTYKICPHNNPVDWKWLDMDMKPMHAALLHIFENLKGQGYWTIIDNLFVSGTLS